MITRLAYVYVYMIAALMSLLLAGLLVFHIGLLTGHHLQLGGHLFAVFFGIAVPALGLAEDRNIWAHEVKACPWWIRLFLGFLFTYTILVMIFKLALGTGPASPDDFALVGSSFMLMFSVACACVLYATLKSARSNPPNLRKRTQRSLLSTTAVGAFYLFLLVLPQKGSH
jgi:hypothetical protein